MTNPEPRFLPPTPQATPSPQVGLRLERTEGLTAWAVMLGVLLVWFGVLPSLVS